MRWSIPLLALAAACGSDPAATDVGDGSAPPVDGSSLEAATDGSPKDGGPAPVTRTAQNPVLGADHADPHVLRTLAPDGKPIYYLTSTIGNDGDLPIYASRDLLTWTLEPKKAFGRASTPGGSIAINGKNYCAIWAPQLVELGPQSFLLSFTAQKYATPQATCPPYAEDGGVYVAWSDSPTGPFARTDHPWEPLPAGAQLGVCADAVRGAIPHSLDNVSPDCQGGFCDNLMRLDSDVARDDATKRWWMSYAWFTNTPPKVAWEQTHHGEHVSLVELSPTDPFAVKCDANVAKVFAVDAHDAALKAALGASCARCGEMLSFTRGRQDEEMLRDGFSWGVAEGPNLLRRGKWVYLFFSHSAWDSAYYAISWIAAPSVEELSAPTRLVGRYLVPSKDQSFGHGTAVLGPDGKSMYFVHHRLDHGACKSAGFCFRDVWVSPLEFEDRGDGKGDVWIKPRFPAETPQVSVTLPP